MITQGFAIADATGNIVIDQSVPGQEAALAIFPTREAAANVSVEWADQGWLNPGSQILPVEIIPKAATEDK